MSDSASSAPLRAELRDAMEGGGCPLCRLASRAERAYVASLSYERVLDLTTRDALKASRGLCASHTRFWADLQGSALGVAIVYRVTVLDLLRDTEPDTASGGFLSRKRREAQVLAERLEPRVPCPACEIGKSAVARFGEVLLTELADADVRRGFIACGGLCLPHLRTVLSLPQAGRGYEVLIEAQRTVWRGLMAELEEFIRKNDYRFVHEPMTETESTSWTRALDAVVGLEEGED
jgi:hypothetical protein